MRYDKQTNSLIIPVSQIATVTRDGEAVDMQNAFLMNLGGQVITIKKDTHEHDSRPSIKPKAKDADTAS